MGHYAARCGTCTSQGEWRPSRRDAERDQIRHRYVAHHGQRPDGETITYQRGLGGDIAAVGAVGAVAALGALARGAGRVWRAGPGREIGQLRAQPWWPAVALALKALGVGYLVMIAIWPETAAAILMWAISR